MSSETVGLLGLCISILGLVAQIFGKDIRTRLIAVFGTKAHAQRDGDPPTTPPHSRLQSARWILVPLAILAVISLALITRSVMGPREWAKPQLSGTDLVPADDAANLLLDTAPPTDRPAPPSAEPASTTADEPFDWRTLRGEIPIWYRTSKDEPLSFYVDAASVETPSPDKRAFWAVTIPNRMTAGFRRVAYMKAKYRADCFQHTLSMGRPVLYDNGGRSIGHALQGDVFADREVAPGSNGRIALRFVCTGPNENSVEVLRGGNLADYLIPTITKAPE